MVLALAGDGRGVFGALFCGLQMACARGGNARDDPGFGMFSGFPGLAGQPRNVMLL